MAIYSHGHVSRRRRAARHGVPLQRNRLNVATSRARCVAMVVASPRLLQVRARTPEQMRLANAFARFAEKASAADYSAVPSAEPVIVVSASFDK